MSPFLCGSHEKNTVKLLKTKQHVTTDQLTYSKLRSGLLSGGSGVPGHQQKPSQHELRMRFLLDSLGAWRKVSMSAVRRVKFGWKTQMATAPAEILSGSRTRSIGLGAMLVIFIMTEKRQDTGHNPFLTHH